MNTCTVRTIRTGKMSYLHEDLFTPISIERNRRELDLGIEILSRLFARAKADLGDFAHSAKYVHITHFEHQAKQRHSSYGDDCSGMERNMMELFKLGYELPHANPVRANHQNTLDGERLVYGHGAFSEQVHFHPSSSSCNDEYRFEYESQNAQETVEKHLQEIRELRKQIEKSESNEKTLNRQLQQSHEKEKKAIEELNSTKTKLNEAQRTIKGDTKSQYQLSKESQDIIAIRTQLKTVMSQETIASHRLKETSEELRTTRDELDKAKTRLNDAQQMKIYHEQRDAQKLSDIAEELKKSQLAEKQLKQLLQESQDQLKETQQLKGTKAKLAETENFTELRDQALSQEINDLKKKLEKSEFKERATNHQLQQTQDTLKKTEYELEETKTRLNEALQGIDSNLKKIERENTDLRIKLEESKSTEASLNQQLQQVRSKLKATTKELEDTKIRFDNESQNAQEADEKHLQEISELRKQIEKSECNEKTLNLQLQQAHEKAKKAIDELNSTKTKLNEAQRTIKGDNKSQYQLSKESQDIIAIRTQLKTVMSQETIASHRLKETSEELRTTRDELDKAKTRLNDAQQMKIYQEQRDTKKLSDIATELKKSQLMEKQLKQQLQEYQNRLKETQQSKGTTTKLAETENCTELRDQALSHEINDLRKKLEKSEFKERATNYQLQQIQDKLNKTEYELEETKTRLNEALQGIDSNLKEIERGNTDLRTKLEESKSAEASLNQQLQQVRSKLKATTTELEDTKIRLSKVMGQKLTDNNPNITDLSDQNRPTKLGERFSELYDNAWTDAFEVVRSIYTDEKPTVLTLLTILTDADKFCRAEAEKQIECLRRDLTLQLETDGSNIPSLINKQIKDCRKALGSDAGQRLLEVYIKKLSQSSSASARDALRVETFLREAFTLCWLMSIQDPPVVFDRTLQHGEKFNTGLYRAYTKGGPQVDFQVWPTIFLHEGGAVLYKGVAQGCEK